MTRIVIGLTGYARSGKDTVADRLVEKHGFTKMSMAGPLKEMLRKLDPILGDTEDGELVTVAQALRHVSENDLKASEYGAEYRRLLQVLGTDCIRSIDENFWVTAMEQAIALSDAARIVIPDCRFPNEFDLVRVGGIEDAHSELWRVSRKAVKPHGGELLHESELYVADAPAIVELHNDGTLEELYESVDDEFASLLESLDWGLHEPN